MNIILKNMIEDIEIQIVNKSNNKTENNERNEKVINIFCYKIGICALIITIVILITVVITRNK